MAFAKGRESSDGSIKRYVGVAPFTVVAVNPTKSEMEKIYGTTLEKEPEYIAETDGVKSVRLDFILKSDSEKCGFDLLTKLSFFLRKEARKNKDNTKIQIIDKYGNTAWVTNEEFAQKAIPMYSNGPANIDHDYRAIYNGEENLTNFLKVYVNIPSAYKWENGKIVGKIENPEDAEARLDNIEKFFTGDVKELKEVVSLQPNNKIKVMLGIKTDDQGKSYQVTYNEVVLKPSSTDYSKLRKSLEERKQNGAYQNVEFETMDAVEWNVKPTNFETPKAEVNPFATDDDLPFGNNN